MKYLIIGAGGTGGVVGFHMAQAGKDVTLIARDAHLESIQQKGLTLQTMWDENTKTIPVKASDMQHYKDRPDVILVCVKGYSLDGIYEFIRRIAKPQTIVIPILNIYGTDSGETDCGNPQSDSGFCIPQGAVHLVQCNDQAVFGLPSGARREIPGLFT